MLPYLVTHSLFVVRNPQIEISTAARYGLERTIQASLNTTYSPLKAGFFDTLLVHIVLQLYRFIS